MDLSAEEDEPTTDVSKQDGETQEINAEIKDNVNAESEKPGKICY